MANGNLIEVFAWPPAPNEMPMRTLSGAATALANIQDIVFDSMTGELFVAVPGAGVLVFDRTQNGNSAPKRSLIETTFLSPTGLDLDLAGNTLWVIAGDTAAAFALDAVGSQVPLHGISSASLGDKIWFRKEASELYSSSFQMRAFNAIGGQLLRSFSGVDSSNYWDVGGCSGW
jgi:hypothetical protein